MSSKYNLGEIIAAGLEAKGIKPDSDIAKKFLSLNADLGKIEVEEAALGEVALLTFESAKSNAGLRQHFDSKAYGEFAMQTENAWKEIADQFGVDSGILKDRDKKPVERGIILAKSIIAKLQDDNKGGKNDDKIKALQDEIQKIQQEGKTREGQIKSELETKLTHAERQLQRFALKQELASGSYGKINPTIMRDFGDSIADSILNDSEKEVVHQNNAWKIINRSDKSVATDIRTGKEINLADVIKPKIKEEWLLKGDESQKGTPPPNGNGGRTLTPFQEAKLAELRSNTGQ